MAASVQQGKLSAHLHIFTFTLGQEVSLGTDLCHLGWANVDKVKLFLLPFPMHLNLESVLLQLWAGSSLLNSGTFTKARLSMSSCLKWCSPGENTVNTEATEVARASSQCTVGSTTKT